PHAAGAAVRGTVRRLSPDQAHRARSAEEGPGDRASRLRVRSHRSTARWRIHRGARAAQRVRALEARELPRLQAADDPPGCAWAHHPRSAPACRPLTLVLRGPHRPRYPSGTGVRRAPLTSPTERRGGPDRKRSGPPLLRCHGVLRRHGAHRSSSPEHYRNCRIRAQKERTHRSSVAQNLLQEVSGGAVVEPLVERRTTAAGHGELTRSPATALRLDSCDQLAADAATASLDIDHELLELSGEAVGVERPHDRGQRVADDNGTRLRNVEKAVVLVAYDIAEGLVERSPRRIVAGRQLLEQPKDRVRVG